LQQEKDAATSGSDPSLASDKAEGAVAQPKPAPPPVAPTATPAGAKIGKNAVRVLVSEALPAAKDAKGAAAGHLVFFAAPSSCNGPERAAASLAIELKLKSLFGDETAHLTLAATPAGELVDAEVDGQKMSFPSPGNVKGALVEQACTALATGNELPESPADAHVAAAVREWVQLIAPDCEFGDWPDAQGAWRCKLPAADADAARQELIGIRTAMIRSWSRQPYLLSRRVAVGIMLADDLHVPSKSDAQLDILCRVIHASLPAELPLVMTSPRWQKTVCDDGLKGEPRRSAAMFALSKTVSEIDFLRQLFERTSKLGSLTVRIPNGAKLGAQFLVNLTPETDVTENLTRETVRLWTNEDGTVDDAATNAVDELPRSCWHPVFGEDETMLRLARNLALSGDAPAVDCNSKVPTKEMEATLEHYVAESITSETEFVIANGHSKTLRLPIGRYTYTLRALPENQDDWDDAAQTAPTAKGEVIWDVKRPRPVIATW
jgi:hypothetical protein